MRLNWTILTVVLLGTLALPAFATTNSTPRVGITVRFGESAPLADVKPSPPAKGREVLHPLDRPELNKKSKKKAKPSAARFDPVLQLSVGPLSMPGPTISFDGLSNSNNFDAFGSDEIIPPDTNGDVGPNHYVQMVNLLLRVFNKSGTPLTSPLTIGDVFAGFGGPCETMEFASDPIVLYDSLADRWLLTQLAAEVDPDFLIPIPPFHECVACSQTSDPTGAYYLYDFVMPNDWVNDYPKFGVWPDAYYMTDNQFDLFTEAPHGAGVFAFDRAKMLAGDSSASYIFFNLEGVDDTIDGLLPADVDGPPPPAGTPNYMTCLSALDFGDPADGLRVFEFHADFADPSSATFTERPESPVAVAAFDPQFACGTSLRDCIAQPPPASSTTAKLDALSDLQMHRLQYRSFGSNESLVVNHTVDAGGNHAGVRYYQMKRNLPGGSFFINEQATYAPDSAHRWMGSAAMDRAGNLAVGYSVSSSSVFPSIRYAGRLASDPSNSLTQGETTLQAGGGSQTDDSSRWGDYSMLAVDPADDCTFWYTSEYYSASSLRLWKTRVGAFKFAGCTNPPIGTLKGSVTNATTGLPFVNATVQTADGYTRQTDAAGMYSMNLPPATYQVTASSPSYTVATASGVVVSNAGTTTRNFTISQAPLLTLVSSAIDDSAGNNNGAIDTNECISLNVVLQNTGLITASNIMATLSTTTPGVSIAQPISAYTTIPVSTSRTNTTPYRFYTASGFVCGAPIHLKLTVTHNGGTNTVPFQRTTGSGIGLSTRFDSQDTPVAIDFVTGGSSSIVVTGLASSVAKVTVSFYMTSDGNSDLDIYLVGPDNTTVALATSIGGAFGAGYGTACSPDGSRTTLDDAAGSSIYSGTNSFTGTYQPEQPLSAFNGKSANGTWTLAVGNFLATASLECWSLFISQPSCTSGAGACNVGDSDGDGLTDSWELLYFGNPTNAVASADSDGDGFSNLAEFQAGTVPTNSASAFRITSIVRTNNDMRVIWQTTTGKTNALERSGAGNYTNNFTGIFTATNTAAGTTNYLDFGAATNSPARYYRVRLVP